MAGAQETATRGLSPTGRNQRRWAICRTAGRSLLVALILLLPLSTAAGEPAAGPEGKTIAQWTEQLKSKEFRQQWHAAYVLGTLGSQAAPAVPALHAVLMSNRARTSTPGAWPPGHWGASVPPPRRKYLLDRNDAGDQTSCRPPQHGRSPGSFGPAAKAAVGELLKMLNNDDEITRVNAAAALWKISRHSKALPALLECFAMAMRRRPIRRPSPWVDG